MLDKIVKLATGDDLEIPEKPKAQEKKREAAEKKHRLDSIRLLIVDDNHTFDALKASGAYRALLRSFLLGGFAPESWRHTLGEVEPHRWRE